MSDAKPYTKEEIARKAWIREWQSGGDEARWLATLDARDAEIAALKARLAEAERAFKSIIDLRKQQLAALCRNPAAFDGVVFHDTTIKTASAFLRPAAPPAKDDAPGGKGGG